MLSFRCDVVVLLFDDVLLYGRVLVRGLLGCQ